MDNVDDIILEDHPDTTFYESIKDTFGDDEFFVIAFSIPDLFTPHVLRSISDITTALEDIPEVREVQSLANVDYIHGAEDYFEVRPFLETIPDDPEGLHLLRLQALENPLYVGNLVSKDARSAAIVVFPKNHDAQDGSFRKRLLDQAQSVLSRHEALIGQFHLAGWTLTNLTLSQYMKTDVAVFVPVTYLFITLTVWLVFRNLRLTLLALTNISACTGATMGLFPYLGITLNTVTTIVPPLIMALALSNSVHIFSHLDRRLLDQQHDPAKSLQMILQRIILPSFLCSLTTAAGFISLAISEIPAIKDFAYAASAGMVFQFFFSFTLLPAMILRCNAERLYADQSASSTLAPFVRHLWNFVSAHPRGICTIAFILTMSAFWCASTISVETNLMENFKSSSTIRKDLDFVASNLSGVATVDISLKSPDTDAFLDPSNLAAMERIQSFAQGLDKVDLCMSFVDFLKDMNQSFHNENPQFYRIPESRELVSQYLLLYDVNDLDEFITAGYDHARILVRISDHGSAGQARIIAALQSFIDLNDNNGLQVRVTGRAVQDVNTIDALVWGQVESLALAAATITLIMFAALRSVAIGALSLVPNVFPIVLNFGIMGALGIPLNTATALISVVALGIAVDDTIHFLTEYNRRRAQGAAIQDSVQRAFLDKGMAMTATSLILVIGFGVLMLSNFVPTVSFGGLSAVIMVTAWTGDLILLPALLLAFQRKR